MTEPDEKETDVREEEMLSELCTGEQIWCMGMKSTWKVCEECEEIRGESVREHLTLDCG